MIAQVTNETYAQWYQKACAGKPYFGCVLPVQLELFGKASGCYFAGEEIAIDANGKKAIATGTTDPEELASFLAFLDKHELLTDGTVPKGWHEKEQLHLFTLEAGNYLPLPPRPEALALNEMPSPFQVAQFLFDAQPERRDDFYSELCTKRNHNKAIVWTLEREGKIISTAGAYALQNGQAYLACAETVAQLRGQGIGGWLIASMANMLSAQGWRVELLAKQERVHLYNRLGFTMADTLTVYSDEDTNETE